MFFVASRDDLSSSNLNISISGVSPNNYTLAVFDLESNGLPVLSDDANPYILAAREENVTVTDPGKFGCKYLLVMSVIVMNHYIMCMFTVFLHLCLCVCAHAADEVASVNGTFLEVPNITNAEFKLCVYFKSSNIDGIVVLAHHTDHPEKLLAYFLNTTCATPPPPGSYIIGVFIQSRYNTLEEPATPLTISVGIVSISEYCFTDIHVHPSSNV